MYLMGPYKTFRLNLYFFHSSKKTFILTRGQDWEEKLRRKWLHPGLHAFLFSVLLTCFFFLSSQISSHWLLNWVVLQPIRRCGCRQIPNIIYHPLPLCSLALGLINDQSLAPQIFFILFDLCYLWCCLFESTFSTHTKELVVLRSGELWFWL